MRTDEALLEVGVDDTRRLRGKHASPDGPRLGLRRPWGGVGAQVEQALTLALALALTLALALALALALTLALALALTLALALALALALT